MRGTPALERGFMRIAGGPDQLKRALELLIMGGVVGFVACTQDVAAPGVCPEFCPSGSLSVIDTVLRTAITRDSSYGRPFGYVNAYGSTSLLAANLPGVRDSRPVFRTTSLATRMILGTDTTTGAVIGVDSLYLRFTITKRDTATRNLSVSIYALPLTIDSTTSFAALATPFAGTPVRTINIDTLLAQPGRKNVVTGDSAVVDTVNSRVTVLVSLDSSQAPYSVADSGKLAFGFRITADNQAAIGLGSFEAGLGPVVTWYLKVDSLGLGTAHRAQTPTTAFDSFVFTPAAAALDSTLAVGGVPSARSLLRITFPRSILGDSSLLTRATLELIPAVSPTGIAADSFGIVASAIVADFGAKTPLDLAHVDTTIVHIGVIDTVRIDVTSILRFWAADTLAPTAIVLRQVPEGADFAEIRFKPSADSTHRPRLRITYSPHYQFGKP